MDSVKKENPNANWGNLTTGVVILIILAVFSFWYFGQNPEPAADTSSASTQQVNTQDQTKPEQTGQNAGTETVAMEETSKPQVTGGEQVTVQQGEGLWHVAARVCGDGEKYNLIADQNGLSVWEWLNEGMTLTVNCGK